MNKYFDIMRKCPLFNNIEDDNLLPMLSCIGANIKHYCKNEYVFTEGEPAEYIGLVLKGSVQIEQTDYFGNRNIVAIIDESELFGESFACADIDLIPVNAVANKDSEIMFLNSKNITKTCCNNCEFHQQIIYNLMKLIAKKNLMFHQKIEITSKRTTREKLMTYLMIQAKKADCNSFIIPYNRQQLADFLEVDRSGLSLEISKLRKEGILKSDKNYFELIQN